VSLPPPLLIKPGCLFDEFLDCRLRQFQDGCAEPITEKTKAAISLPSGLIMRSSTPNRKRSAAISCVMRFLSFCQLRRKFQMSALAGYPTSKVNRSVAQAGNINPVHMGVVLIATLAFGLITPPYGLVLLMASKFVGVRFSQALSSALPIYVVFLVTISFCIYFPKVVLWLPKQVMPAAVGCFKNPSGPGYIYPP
jgi:hypothetical protein